MEFSKAVVPLILALCLVKATSQARFEDAPDRFHAEEQPPDREDRFHHEQDDDGRERERAYRIEGNDDFKQEQDKLEDNKGDYRKEDGDYRKEDGDYRKEDGDYRKEDGDYRKEDGDYKKEDGGYRKEQGNDGGYRQEDDDFINEGNDDFLNEGNDDFLNEGDDDRKYEGDDDVQIENNDDFESELREVLQKLASMQKEQHTKSPKANLQKEGHTKPKPKMFATLEEFTKPPKRVTFEEDTDTEALVQRMMESGGDYNESPGDDDAMSQWVMVTAEGYEYGPTQSELEMVSQESRAQTRFSAEHTQSYFDANTENGLEVSSNATVQKVFGRDSRFRIYNPNRYPWSAIGRVDTGCTGTFIGPRHILTAGHCVFNPYTRRWRRNLNFRRAKNCDSNGGAYYRWKTAVTVHGWIRGRQDYNYAVIVVTANSPSWMSFGWRSSMPRYFVNIPGYPWDKSNQCMWHSYCYLIGRYSRLLTHRCDTSYGMSGSPVYVRFRYYRVIYGVNTGSLRYRNLAVRINRRRYKTLRYIIRRFR